MYSGLSGSRNTSNLKMYLRRGDSAVEGVKAVERSATYYWSPVSQWKLTALSALYDIPVYSVSQKNPP